MANIETIDRYNVEDIVQLSPMQEGLLFHYMKNPESNLYLESITFDVTGEIEEVRFKEAWDMVIGSNEMLRTTFRWKNLKKPIQVVLKKAENLVRVIDCTKNTMDLKDQNVDALITEEREKSFDLHFIPFKVVLYQVSSNHAIMLLAFHHIILDGWSTGILLKEFARIYKELSKGIQANIKVKAQYKSFVQWQLKDKKDSAKEFWQSHIPKEHVETKFPLLKQNASKRQMTSLKYTLSSAQTSQLIEYAKRRQITLASIIYSAWGIQVSKYCDSSEVIFGTTVSGRKADIQGIEDVAGLFINTIPLRVVLEQTESVKDIITQVNQVLDERSEFENTSLTDIKSFTGTNREGEQFDTIVVVENYPIDEELYEDTDIIKLVPTSVIERPNFDFTLVVSINEQIEFRIIYNEAILEKSGIQRCAQHYERILNQMVLNEDCKLKEITLLDERESSKILLEFNETESEYPKENTIQQLFERQVELIPEKPAVIDQRVTLSYRELNARANQVAHFLREKGVTADEPVAITASKRIEVIIGILGILKAGGAYLPIDPKYPQERVMYMIRDSKAKVLITFDEFDTMTEFEGEVVVYHEDMFEGYSNDNLVNKNQSNSMAYIIYTSGSTGNPKGVMVEHRNVIRLVINTNYIHFVPEDRILQTGSIAFDASTFEIWGALLNGLSLYLCDENIILNPAKLQKVILDNKITTMWFTVSLFNQLVEINEEIFAPLHNLLVGGDSLSPKHINRILDLYPNIHMVNGYGPTENTTFSVCMMINQKYENSIPIGRPISNSYAYILNAENQLQPIGIPGELCVGGDGVARGYINRPELTQERFVEDPFHKGQRMYRTGDIAYWLEDGTIQFVGRVDGQVKIRGFRVEVSEIEEVLRKEVGVQDAIVLIQESPNGEKEIIAYIASGQEIMIKDLKVRLARKLPSYMIPQHIMWLERLTLNQNGKVDRSALPKFEMIVDEHDYIEPTEEIHKKIAEIWRDVLGVDRISITDNFFDIGGNSILLMKVFNRMDALYPNQLKITDLFAYPTIELIAQYIKDESTKINIDLKIATVPIAADYFGEDQEQQEAFEFQVRESNYRKLQSYSQSHKVQVTNVLYGLFSYLFYELTDSEHISLQRCQNGKVKVDTIDFEQIEDLDDLFQSMQADREGNHEVEYEWENLNHYIGTKKEGELAPLYCMGKLATTSIPVYHIFDLILEVSEEENELSCYISYDAHRLRSSKIGMLTAMYKKVLSEFIKEL